MKTRYNYCRAFSHMSAVVAARRNERLSTVKPAGRNRRVLNQPKLDPAVTRCDKVND